MNIVRTGVGRYTVTIGSEIYTVDDHGTFVRTTTPIDSRGKGWFRDFGSLTEAFNILAKKFEQNS